MRRLVVFVALCGICLTSGALAAPNGQYQGRQSQQYGPYDDDDAPPPRRYAPANYQEELPPADGGGFMGQPPMDDGGQGWGQPAYDYPCGFGNWGDCCAPRGLWARAEYLYWWVRGANTPALVTTSPDNTPQPEAGVLPGAVTLFGNQNVNTAGRSGGRFTLGYWCNECETAGVEASFLFLGQANQGFFASSGGSPILARPFFNTQSNANDADLIAFPNFVTGTVNVSTYSKVYGFDVNMRRALYADEFRRLDVLVGYRFFYLSEGLSVNTNTTSIDTQSTIPVGTQFGILDSFATTNAFNGGQIGLNQHFFNGPWSFDLLAKVALGAVSQRVTINGSTTVTEPGLAPVTSAGGILALASNSGQFNRTQFGVLPEFAANLHYQFTPFWRLNVGYTLLILSNVVRPGDQVDTHLDPNQFPPPAAAGTSPAFAFHNSTIWLQGINFGVECNF